MIEVLPESEDDTLAIAIRGELSADDYKKLEPEMSLRRDHHGAFCVLVDLDEVEQLDPAAIREDLRFTKDYGSSIRRLAVVTDEPVWRGLSDFVGKPLGQLLGTDVERFDTRVDAWKWLQN